MHATRGDPNGRPLFVRAQVCRLGSCLPVSLSDKHADNSQAGGGRHRIEELVFDLPRAFSSSPPFLDSQQPLFRSPSSSIGIASIRMSSILQSTTTPAAGDWRQVANPLTWPARLQAQLCQHPVQAAASATIFAGFVFMAFPGIDLAVSRWAAAGDADFPLSREHALRLLRDLNRIIPVFLLPAVAAMLAVQVSKPRAWLPRPHKMLFFLTFYAIGPGVAIQLLKRLVGRARPNEIVEFGGTLPFTPAWQVSSACSRSCSFASGESATAIALLALACFLPERWRLKAVVALVPVVLVFSLNRIAFGAHFLSDVVLAWLLMLWIMLWWWSVISAHSARIDAALVRRRPSENRH